MSATLETDVLVIGSGAGGAVTAATLTRAGRAVTVVEEGPWVDPDAVEPFSLDEMVAKYRHRPAATLGAPSIAYAEGCCVGGSTEINSGLYHRLPASLAETWRAEYDIDEFEPAALDGYAERIERELGVSRLPGAPPTSSALLERGATKLGWQAVEYARVFRYDASGRGVKQTMTRTLLPRAVDGGATVIPNCRVHRLACRGRRAVAVECRRREGGREEPLTIRAEHVFVCGGAIQTPALLHRSGIRSRIGSGLKLHPMIKVAARFPHPVDHGGVPMQVITEFGPNLSIGGSASRRGQVAMALAESSHDLDALLAEWEHISIYYAAIRTEGRGRVVAVPGLRAPVVTYRLTDGDLSRLARGLVHLGELLLAAGATELYPSVRGAAPVRDESGLGSWWDAVTRDRADLMTVHLTSTVRMGEDKSRAGADSFGRVRGLDNVRVNDASALPDAPGVNPQGTIMALAVRNCEHFLSEA